MATKMRFRLTGRNKDSYLDLVLDFPLASIKNDEHLMEAEKIMARLLARGSLNEGEETYLDALSGLVGVYEDEHHSIAPASDAEMLRHLLDAKGITAAQLCRDTNLPKSTISEVLRGKKSFSRQMMHKLSEYFHIDVSILAANI